MADHYVSCKACRGQILPGGKYYGRYCSSKCKDSARDQAKLSAKVERAKERQKLNRKHLCCPVCSGPLKDRRKLCSDTCKAAWRLQWQRAHQGFKGIAKPQPVNPCKHCGTGFKARIQSGRRFEYCSHECLWESMRQQREAIDRAERERLACVMPEVLALRRIARYVERPRVWVGGCVCCSKSMVIRLTKGGRKRVCDECTLALRIKNRRISKARRRARIKGRQHDAIDPLNVFERDGWHCYLCNRPTPRELRGTYEPQAPELEHIIPLSKGGTHTWANVACACRECNRAKSDSLEAIYTYKSMG